MVEPYNSAHERSETHLGYVFLVAGPKSFEHSFHILTAFHIMSLLDQHLIEGRDPYSLDSQTARGDLTCWRPTACKQVMGGDGSTSGSPGAAPGVPCPHSGVVRQQEGFYTRRTLPTGWHCLQLCCSQTYLWFLLVLKIPGLPTTFTSPFLL